MWVCHITRTPGCSTALCSVPLFCTHRLGILRRLSRTLGVTTVVAPKRVPTPTDGVFPASPTKNSGKQKILQQGKTTTWSKDEPVKLSLQLCTPLRRQTLSVRVSSLSPPTLRWRGNGGIREAANELRAATLHCDLRGILQARSFVHNLAASFDGLLQAPTFGYGQGLDRWGTQRQHKRAA